MSGAPTSGVILHVPHSSRHIPPDVRASILLDDDALAAELDQMTDAHTSVIASQAASSAWVFVNRHSRLVVDLRNATGANGKGSDKVWKL